MTYHDREEETPDDAGLDDRELPDESDMDDPADEDSAETVPCPYCRKPVYEGAEICPGCGSYVSSEDAPAERKPWWIVAAVVVCLVMILLAWVLR